MAAALWGFIGTLVGALASIGATWLSNRQASSLQASASMLARIEARRVFQRDTLLELQEAVLDLMRLIAQGDSEDRAAHRKTGVWGKQLLTPEVNEGQRLANRRLTVLVQRVADDALRSELKTFHSALSKITLASSAEESEHAFKTLSGHLTQVMEHLGAELRAQY
ncbi:hypothetical protein [Rhodanobacter glycinis]|uniref:hypothetical protein n=1 Tax=Rhodanobacter glycinis TaxID=582702 RepID=UPI00112BA3E5|nr:hypothetical protein [Rhodanobacter glycinis]